jgi:glucose-1-phosphate thymidylyltransferase
MRVVILAAGYGTRLYPLTLRIAKPLLPINNKPIINFLIDKVENLRKYFPVTEVVIVVNNKFYKSFISWKKKYKIEAKIINDGSDSPRDKLGAIKDIKFAIQDANTDWLVMGGDNLFEDDLIDFVRFSYDKKPYVALGIYDVRSKSVARRFGIVKLNDKNQIVSFQEKPKRPISTLAASCVYFFPKHTLGSLDSFIYENKNVDASGQYIAWLAKSTKVFGYKFKGKWIDIGHFDALKEAKRLFKVSLRQ